MAGGGAPASSFRDRKRLGLAATGARTDWDGNANQLAKARKAEQSNADDIAELRALVDSLIAMQGQFPILYVTFTGGNGGATGNAATPVTTTPGTGSDPGTGTGSTGTGSTTTGTGTSPLISQPGGTPYQWDGKSHLRLDTSAASGTVILPDAVRFGPGRGARTEAKIINGANGVTFQPLNASQYIRLANGKQSSATMTAGSAWDFENDGVDTTDVV